MLVQRRLRKGDRIRCQGYEYEIGEVLYQDCYRDDWNSSRSYIDIEFKDTQGGYHHWKSHIDGGKAIIVDTLKRYMDTTTGWYIIPFNEMVGDVTEEVLERISYSGVLLADDNNGVKNYILINCDLLNFATSVFTRSDALYSIVKDWMDSIGSIPFVEVSLEDYYKDTNIQEAVDYVLLKSTEYKEKYNTNGLSLGLKKTTGYLYFVKTDAWWR